MYSERSRSPPLPIRRRATYTLEDEFETTTNEFHNGSNSVDYNDEVIVHDPDEEEDVEDGDEDDEEEEDEEEDDEQNEEEEEEEEETTTNNDNLNTSNIIQATTTLSSLSDPSRALLVREIGNDAVWTLSTAKPGNGVAQIRDSSIDTYWQSDGGQPHLINIHFLKRRAVCEIAFYLDFNQDESYTPKKISIRSGMTFHDLEEIKEVELNDPVGWVSVPLHAEKDPLVDDDDDDDDDNDDDDEHDSENDKDNDNDVKMKNKKNKKKKKQKPLRTFLLQICIVTMHQNGRDLHCRQVKVFGPRLEEMNSYPIRFNQRSSLTSPPSSSGATSTTSMKLMDVPKFRSVGMSKFSVVR